MGAWAHSGGFSLDATVRIEGDDREGLERLLRYCARPAFALERLREIDPEHLVYESVKPGPGGSVSLMLTPLELLDRLAALIPPPRRHRHRYFGVLAPNSPLRSAVTALAGSRAETPDWHARGIRLYVFSSGSVQAQKLLFAHTDFGDLTPLFSREPLKNSATLS